jgi:hypothetical protein
MEGHLICAVKTCKGEITCAQPSILCWLCDNVVHAKCVNVTGSTADALAKRIGLHYCCEECREVQNEMRAFMRQTRKGFKELFSGFRTLSKQFSKLDSDFNGLQLLNESPKRKKSTRKEETMSAAVPPPNVAQPSTPLTQPLIPVTTSVVTRSAAQKNSVSECVNSESSQPVTPKIPTILAPASIPVSASPRATTTASLSVVPKPLVGIPPRKQIFVSRLAPDLTSDDVMAFIQAKIQAAEIKVEKFKFSYERDVSSFKLCVPNDCFNHICTPDFWPAHIVVKEFEAKKKKNRPPIRLTLPNQTTAPNKTTKN